MNKKEIITLLEKAIKEGSKGVPGPKGVPGSKGVSSPKGVGASASSTPSTAKVVNEPKKNPRKSVFSEIKKIT